MLISGLLCALCFSGCSQKNNDESETYLGENIEDVQLFPASDAGYVGDPMPFYDDGVFHVFYLLDQRGSDTGYHPWALYDTENFYQYEDQGIVIPYSDDIEAQDIALGTGSVIRDKDGLYHAFYTGHNDTYTPKEAVMHATSEDLINWEKIPEDTFTAGDHYSQNDFRDPYVLWVEEENRYWMLVVTRSNNTGVIVKYTSEDLKTWKDEGVFFENDLGTDSNMECPSLLFYEGKWYLAFSDQWPDRVVHYRISEDINGPFQTPQQDTVDSDGFYAGRLESDGENLYVFGWNATKVDHSDSEDYDWAGNLVVHQLVQKDDGSLAPVINDSVKKGMDHELSLEPVRMTETIEKHKNNYTLSGENYEAVEFKNMLGSYLFEATVTNFKDSEKFGIAFQTDEDAVGGLNIVFDVANNKLAFYNTDALYAQDPQSEIAFDYAKADQFDISMMISDGVASVYINGECAMTARMYGSQGTTWGIFGINSNVQFENVKIYK